jgi:hypothetical protein
METLYTKIYTGNFILIRLMIERLEHIGITPIIKDESESGRLAGFGAPIQNQQELFVHNDELDKAVPIIQSALAEMQS